jgi:hypothetical protein
LGGRSSAEGDIDPEPGVLYPRLIEVTESRDAVLPRTSAAPWGYAEPLEAIHDPKHERHAEFKEWITDDFDPNAVDAQRLTEEVAELAKSWSRKSPAKRTRRA